MYLQFLFREAVKNKREGIFWVTPEEFEIFSDKDVSIKIIEKMKNGF